MGVKYILNKVLNLWGGGKLFEMNANTNTIHEPINLINKNIKTI